MIRIVREIGDGIKVTGARLRIRNGLKIKCIVASVAGQGIAATSAGDSVIVARSGDERVGAGTPNDDKGVGYGKMGIDG